MANTNFPVYQKTQSRDAYKRITNSLKTSASVAVFLLTSAITAPSFAASNDDIHNLSITEHALSAAFVQLSRQTGVAVFAPSQLVKGKLSAEISGAMTIEEAIEILLANTSLRFEKTSDGNIIIRQNAPQSGFQKIGYTTTEEYEAELGVYEDDERADEIDAGMKLEEIVVTGSRIQRRDYVSASPIVTVDSEKINSAGYVNIDKALGQMPQFNPTASGASGSVVVEPATVNLRGLGANRNLVLLDGRRMPAATPAGVVDINTLPGSIIGNVEVISGGASAVYGSDAISGVVNFRTRKNFVGTEINLQGGLSDKGDAENFQLSGLIGRDFADDRGHVLLSASYSRRGELMFTDRIDRINLYNLAAFTSTGNVYLSPPNAPTQAAVDAVFGQYGVTSGTVSPYSSFAFNNDGSLYALNGGYNYQESSTRGYSRAELVNGNLSEPILYNRNLIQGQDRYNVFGKVDFDLTENLTVFAQSIYTKSVDTSKQWVNQTHGSVIPVTNPFVPGDLLTLLNSRAAPAAPFLFLKAFEELPRTVKGEAEIFQVVLGAEGSIDFGDINWNLYYSHSESTFTETNTSVLLKSRLNELLFAADGGASLCDGGFNPFGSQQGLSTSQDCIDYMTTTAVEVTKTRQNVIEGSFGGALFPLFAGEVLYSLTASYRDDSAMIDADPRNRPLGVVDPDGLDRPADDLAGYPSSASLPWSKISVTEIAGEVLIPLLQDESFAQSLNLNLGGRYSDYSTVGGIYSYRAELDYQVNDSIMFRAGYERAVRAANIEEAFSPATGSTLFFDQALPVGGDPCDVRTVARAEGGNALRNLCVATGVPSDIVDIGEYPTFSNSSIQGNPDVEPEVADTFTFGVVYTPQDGFFSGVTASIDYYDIKIDKVITSVSAQNIVYNCYNTDGVSNPTYDPNNVFCQALTRGATGALIDVLTQPENLGNLHTRGIDAQIGWGMGLEDGSHIRLSAYGSYLLKFAVKASPTGDSVDYAGFFADQFFGFAGDHHPRFKSNVSVSYNKSAFDISLSWRHLAGMKDLSQITTPTSALPNTKAYDVFDLTGSYEINDMYTVSFGINNLFDKEPSYHAGVAGDVSFRLYDIVGRRMFIGVKASF